MPNRILRESICTSDTLATISADAERVFFRLIVQADDYGRFDGRPHIVRAACFAAMVDQYTTARVKELLGELEAAGLIQQYTVDGRPYLCLTTWEKHQLPPRAKQSRYPEPPSDTCEHLHADARKCEEPSDTCEHLHADVTVFDNRLSNFENRDIKTLSPNGDMSASAAPTPDDPVDNPVDDPVDNRDTKPQRLVPHQAIVEAWNEVCGHVLPQVRVLSDKRRDKLRARCRELARVFGDEVYSPDWWRGVFRRVRDSPFLRGENRSGWRASLDWLIERRDAVAKVLEGQYQGAGPPKTEFERVRELFQAMERVEDSGW